MAILTLIKAGNKIYKNKDKIKRYTDSFFTDKKAIKKANQDNEKARKTAAQRLKDKFNKDK